MKPTTCRSSSRLALWMLQLGALALAPQAANAHTLLQDPAPRDGSDSHKDPDGPCGVARAPAQAKAVLSTGARQTVTWHETVNHPGCFVIDFANQGDAGWVTLSTVEHSAAGSVPRPYAAEVTLPAQACPDCTLRLRQIMLSEDVPAGQACPPANLGQGLTYYSCANVALEAGQGSSSAAVDDQDGGCALAKPATPAQGNVALLLPLLGLLLAVRRHRLVMRRDC